MALGDADLRQAQRAPVDIGKAGLVNGLQRTVDMIGPGMIGTDELFRLPLLLHRQRRSAMAAYVAERLEAAVLLPRDDQGNAQYPVTDEPLGRAACGERVGPYV